MTPQLRARCAITVAVLLLQVAPVAHAEGPKAPERPQPSASASLAGRQAGEGRQRPGRPVTPTPSASASAAPSRTPAAAVSPPVTRAPSKAPRPLSQPPTAEEGPHRPDEQDEDTPPGEEKAPRTEAPAEDGNVWPPAPPPTEPAAARHQAPHTVPAPVAPQVSPLSLGVGMTLMGLGIGFLGARLRRR